MSAQLWTGEVVESEDMFGGIPRTIAMSWSDCDTEVCVPGMMRVISVFCVQCAVCSVQCLVIYRR